MSLSVTFRGVRGSLPTPRAENLKVGGNTSCVEVRTQQDVLIIDGGTGLQSCGREMLRANGAAARDIWILLSHFHWDHLQGLPFFEPLYSPEFRLNFANSGTQEATRSKLQQLMAAPYFPVNWENTAAHKHFHSLGAAGLDLNGVSISPLPLHHPQGATGFIIRDTGQKKIVYASDFEHGDPAADLALRQASEGADLLIYDAQYTPDEYERGHRGWGHSTWREATRVAKDAGVKRLILFHHDPSHDDAMLGHIESVARNSFPATELAVENRTILLD